MNEIRVGQKVRVLVGKELRDGTIKKLSQSKLSPAVYTIAIEVKGLNCTLCLVNQTAESLFKQMVVVGEAQEPTEYSCFGTYNSGDRVVIRGKEYEFVKAPKHCEECSNCDLQLQKCEYECDNARGNCVLKLCK